MKKYRFFALVLLLALTLAGCSLALTEDESAAANDDKMVGVLITFEPLDLFDFESYFNDHVESVLNGGTISQADAKKYSGCLFAEKDEESGDYSFPEVEGLIFLCTEETDEVGSYIRMQGGEGIDATKNHFTTTDSGEAFELAGTVYFAPENRGDIVAFYTNPVYKTADGRVYAQSGQGMSGSWDEGSNGSMTATLSQSLEETKNGEKKSYSAEYAITMQAAAKPLYSEVFWMKNDGNVLRSARYEQGAFPKELDARDADFLLLMEHAADGSVRHEVYARDESDTQPHAFMCGDGRILIAQYASVVWE